MTATYLGENGYEFEREEANKVFKVGESYEVVAGHMGRERSSLEFKGIKGRWNAVMFNFGKDVDLLLDRAFAADYQYR